MITTASLTNKIEEIFNTIATNEGATSVKNNIAFFDNKIDAILFAQKNDSFEFVDMTNIITFLSEDDKNNFDTNFLVKSK